MLQRDIYTSGHFLSCYYAGCCRVSKQLLHIHAPPPPRVAFCGNIIPSFPPLSSFSRQISEETRVVMETDWASVRSELANCGQEHLLQFLDELTESEKAELYGDIRDIDFGRVASYFGDIKAALVGNGEKKDEVLTWPLSC